MDQEPARAKINLTLDITGRRSDGYHELETVMQTLALSDFLTFLPAAGEISVTCSHPEVPAGEGNLVWKAAVLIKELAGGNKGAKIELKKNIPVAAGLAGGSADAAAALKGLNRLWNAGLTEGELLALGERLGADVPFCLLGGTALARGKGEVLTPLPSLKGLGVVLVKPPFGVSTAAAYRLYDRLGGGPRPANRQMLAALEKKDLPAVGRLLGNVFEGPVFSLYPELREVKEALLRAGVLGASLSGSGPAVFGLCRDREQAAQVAGRLRLPLKYTVLVTETV